MSIEPYQASPPPIPDVSAAVVGIPDAWWSALVDYKARPMRKLTLAERDHINRRTVSHAAALLRARRFRDVARRYGPDHALRCVRDAVRAAKREAVADARDARAEALQSGQRVPCGAAKKDGWQCRAMSEPGRNRCRFHGGQSTGPRTLDGKRRALAALPQYRADPAALAARLAEWSARMAAEGFPAR